MKMRFEVENLLKEDPTEKKKGQLLLQRDPKGNDYEENPNTHFMSSNLRLMEELPLQPLNLGSSKRWDSAPKAWKFCLKVSPWDVPSNRLTLSEVEIFIGV